MCFSGARVSIEVCQHLEQFVAQSGRTVNMDACVRIFFSCIGIGFRVAILVAELFALCVISSRIVSKDFSGVACMLCWLGQSVDLDEDGQAMSATNLLVALGAARIRQGAGTDIAGTWF
jgi:hypothetical protein